MKTICFISSELIRINYKVHEDNFRQNTIFLGGEVYRYRKSDNVIYGIKIANHWDTLYCDTC